MNISAAPSTASPLSRLFWLAIVGAGIFYFAPWSSHTATSLTFGAYDLAEWTSLHPSVRFVEPVLQTTLSLRLPPVLLIIVFALAGGVPRFSWMWWFSLAVVLVGALALMPPLEFFAATDDPNYRQQALLTVMALSGGLIALSGLVMRVRWPLISLLCAGAILSAITGLRDAQALWDAFHIDVGLGVGVVGFVACVFFAGAFAFAQLLRKTA